MTPLAPLWSAPPILLVTDRAQAAGAGRSLTETIACALTGGPPGLFAVLFREKDLPAAERRALALDVAAAVREARSTMVVASDVALAHEVRAAAVHLAAADPAVSDAGGLAAGRSCHDEDELRRALAAGAAYATVSPVFMSASKPGYGPALGVDGLARLVQAAAGLPVYGLGGVTPANAHRCLEAAASGIAVMGAVMSAPDPAACVSALVDALEGAKPR